MLAGYLHLQLAERHRKFRQKRNQPRRQFGALFRRQFRCQYPPDGVSRLHRHLHGRLGQGVEAPGKSPLQPFLLPGIALGEAGEDGQGVGGALRRDAIEGGGEQVVVGLQLPPHQMLAQEVGLQSVEPGGAGVEVVQKAGLGVHRRRLPVGEKRRAGDPFAGPGTVLDASGQGRQGGGLGEGGAQLLGLADGLQFAVPVAAFVSEDGVEQVFGGLWPLPVERHQGRHLDHQDGGEIRCVEVGGGDVLGRFPEFLRERRDRRVENRHPFVGIGGQRYERDGVRGRHQQRLDGRILALQCLPPVGGGAGDEGDANHPGRLHRRRLSQKIDEHDAPGLGVVDDDEDLVVVVEQRIHGVGRQPALLGRQEAGLPAGAFQVLQEMDEQTRLADAAGADVEAHADGILVVAPAVQVGDHVLAAAEFQRLVLGAQEQARGVPFRKLLSRVDQEFEPIRPAKRVSENGAARFQ